MRHLFTRLIGWIILISPALGQAELNDHNTPEGWAWSQIVAGKVADFDERCKLVMSNREDASCREIDPVAVEKMITDHSLRDQIPHHGARFSHAHVIGKLDLSNMEVMWPISIADSLIKGDLEATGSRFHFSFKLPGSTLNGDLQASGAQLDQDLELENTSVQAVVNLIGTTISGFGHFKGLRADYLIMDDAHIGKDFILDDFKLLNTLPDNRPCPEEYRVCAHAIQVLGQFSMRDISVHNTTFYIGDGKIGGDFWASGSIKKIFLDSARIGGTLHLEYGSIGGLGKIDILDLTEAQIGTVMQVNTKIRHLVAPGLQVGSDANVNLWGNIDHTDEDKVIINLEHARISRNLTIEDVAQLSHLDLSESSAADLSLQNIDWSKGAFLNLATAHFGTIRNGNNKPRPIWPNKMQIAGLTYTNLPIITATNSSPDSILEWLRLDKNAPGQYTQIAGLFSTQGDRDNAAKFQLAAREQEMKTICSQGITGYCIFLHALWWVDGFGIGDYIWSVLWWILGICVFGTFVVLTVPSAGVPVLNALRNAAGIGSNIRCHSGFRRIGAEVWAVLKGVIWALGASLEKMLPFVHLDKSFTEFFEKEEGFRLWHKVIFTMLALLGSILGLFLAAAAAGLTQRG